MQVKYHDGLLAHSSSTFCGGKAPGKERNKIEKGKIFKSYYMTLKFKTHFHNCGSDFFFKQTFLLGLHLHLQFHLLILTPK